MSPRHACQRLLLLLAGFFTVIALVCPPAVAGNIGFQPVSAEELKMTGDPAAPGAPAIILYRELYRDDNGSTTHEDNYLRIKILTEEGRKYADIEIPFAKGILGVSDIHARSIAPDGTISNFDGKIFENTIVKARGVKFLAKVLALPNVQVGSVMEYYYTLDFPEHFVYSSHWVLSEELFTKHAKFALKSYDPRYGRVNLHWSWRELPPGTNPPVQGADHVIRLDAYNIPAFQTEDFMPPPNELKSRVDFVYSFESPETDKDKFWIQVGKTRNEFLETFVGKHGAVQSAVSQVVSASDSPEVKMQKMYARVQQLRNTSYESSKTEAEEKRDNPKANKNVDDVWKNGYGSGGQLTWLYLAMARAAGFEAYGVWVSDRKNYFFDPTQMDASRLDANAVLIKLNGKEVYCDPGAEFAPYGVLPWYETGVSGLRLDKDGGTWIHTPVPASSASQIIRKANLKITDTGDLEGTVSLTYTGLEAMVRRVEQRHADDADRKKYLEDQVKEYIPAGADVELQTHPDWNSSALELTAEFKLKVAGWASSAGKRVLVPVGLFVAPEKGLFAHANRIHPVYFEFPFQKNDDIWIDLPAGWKINNLPAAQKQGGQTISYSLSAEQDKNKIHIARSLQLNIMIVSAKQYAVLRGFFQSVRTADDAQVMVQPGVATASN